MFLLFFSILLIDSLGGTGDPPQKEKPHVVFLISEDPDNYEAPRTIPVFAETLKREEGFKVTVLLGEGERSAFRFPGLELVSEADLIVVFCRRVALTPEQLGLLKNYLKGGKPLIGIRTANHAFTALGEIAAGHEAWPEFVADILGCQNRGYGPQEVGTEVSMVPSQKKHSILKGFEPAPWHAEGSTYLVSPLLDQKATVLVMGSVEDKVEPIAWTRYTADQGRVFYTSLGYPSDFNRPQFKKLLVNGIYWSLGIKKR
ncbi:MAG: ThuA domain-containing protein [Cyclobacteriaceae bacterium]